jgi:putative spermidine/putrescine transport system permease protein
MLASQNEKRKEMLSNNGIPLKKKLSRALFQSRLRAFGLVTPLLLLISIGFVFPIIVFLTRGVYNDTFEKYMVNLTPILAEWDGKSEPTEEMYEALVLDLVWLKKTKNHFEEHFSMQLLSLSYDQSF